MSCDTAKPNHQAAPSVVTLTVVIFLSLHLHLCSCHDSSYSKLKTLIDEKLGEDNYNPKLRPVRDQSYPMYFYFSFLLMSLVDVNDVEQTFSIDGMAVIVWWDEFVTWNPANYSKVVYFSPKMSSVWKPRMYQLNTLGDRDPFGDKLYPLKMFFNGFVEWMPGGLLTTTCALDMEKYPFDVQECGIKLCPMMYRADQLRGIIVGRQVRMDYYIANEGWDVLNATVENSDVFFNGTYISSCPTMMFKIKRRPHLFIINVIFPVILLSLLNILVFLIPAESGEKIGYGITVLLALSLCLSLVGSILPKASGKTPAVSLYLFSQLLMSALSVTIAILISSQQKSNEEDGKEETSGNNPQVGKEESSNPTAEKRGNNNHLETETYGLKKICQHFTPNVNKVCFTVFLLLWAFTTLAYFIHVIE